MGMKWQNQARNPIKKQYSRVADDLKKIAYLLLEGLLCSVANSA